MATITVGTVTFAPAPGGVSWVNYNYTLQCTDQECALPAGFNMNVSFTGIDKWINDDLATRLDPHVTNCPANCSANISRSFPVASSELNEDWGQDEVRLNLHSRPTTGGAASTSSSGTVTGNF